MKTIFYSDSNRYSTEEALNKLLSNVYGIQNSTLLRTKNGKPYVENAPHFSITHTNEKLFIVFSQYPIGLDAELSNRNIDYLPILKKFPYQETEEIKNLQDFLTHWIVKESLIKYFGSTLASGLKNFSFVNGQLYKGREKLSILPHLFEFEKHLLCICAEEAFDSFSFVPIP